MNGLFTKILPGTIPYTGRELSAHWIAKKTEHFGSSVVAFRGPCEVASEEMVDVEDSVRNLFIRSEEMLHFLGEWFEGDIRAAVLTQRLFIASFAEALLALRPQLKIERRGNDLYVHDGGVRKLSVSIVTATPVSTLFHFGVNISAKGAPVQAIGLSDLGIPVDELASLVLERWKEEWAGVEKARCKVSPR